MKKVKFVLIFIVLIFSVILGAFFFLKPAQNIKNVTSNIKTTTSANARTEEIKTASAKQNKKIFEDEKKNNKTTSEQKLKKKPVIKNINKEKKIDNEDYSKLTPIQKELLKFTLGFGRNIFQEKIELDTPVLNISEYESPDLDGKVLISWKNIKDATEYSLEINGKPINKVKNPYTLKGLKNGKYSIRLIAKNKNGTSKWSKSKDISVKITTTKKIKREIINIKVMGIIARGGKFMALIDDKIYRVGDTLHGGEIKSISIKGLTLEKKGLIYNFKVKK